MKIRGNNQAVAEIIGAMVLLAIAVAAFSVIYLNVLSNPGPSEETYVTIVGKMENKNVTFNNQRGENIDLDSNVILKIANNQTVRKNVSELLDYIYKNNNLWNIGERLLYNPMTDPDVKQTLENVQIDATIVDKKSNSIVFWGRLQEGYVITSFGLGGIWHFDEPVWDGTINEVKDTSGNNNHGTARHGAQIVTEADNVVSGHAGFFDEIDDYVEVPSSYSLNITNAITLEAYIKPLIGTRILKWGEFSTQFYFRPNIIMISQLNEINYTCAVVGEEQGRDASLCTIKINTYNGTITPLFINYIFGNAPAGTPGQLWSKIVHVIGDLYVMFMLLYIKMKVDMLRR